MKDNTDIKSILTPRREFKASEKLRERINHTLDEHTVNRKWVRTAWGASASLMAAALLWLILIPTGLSAKEVLAEALKSLKEVQTVEMIAEVRTTPMENFKYISLNADFVAHRIGIVRTDSALVWRIDKGKRVAIGNQTTSSHGSPISSSADISPIPIPRRLSVISPPSSPREDSGKRA